MVIMVYMINHQHVELLIYIKDIGRDVGGQKSERRKSMSLCGDIDVVLFVFSLSSYDQVLFEDGYTNRSIDSFDLFEQQCRYKVFENTHFVVCLFK